MRDTCSVSRELEDLASAILDLERQSKVWKVRETSITDLIIAKFKCSSSNPRIEVDASHEITTNADFEVIIRLNGKDLTFLIQAKRADLLKSGKYTIPDLFYPGSTGRQNKELIDHALKNDMHALYAIYLPSGAAANLSTSGTKAKPRGIMLQDAIAIRKKCFKTGNNVKLVNRALSRSIPFHELFCAAEDSLDLRALESRIIEKIRSSSDENRKSRITNQIDLQTRRERDQTERHYRRGEGQFISNTPRILIDLDK